MNRPTRLFNAEAFADELSDKVNRLGLTVRGAAELAGVSPATFTRAVHVWPELSYENWLRLRAWLDEPETVTA